jgi:membrane-bound lytic murein transglycosylase F
LARVAAYNLGFGHLEDARIITQSVGANPDSWDQVRDRLAAARRRAVVPPRAARLRAGQIAVGYVDNIRRYYEILMWIDGHETFTNQRDIALVDRLPIG